MGLFSSIVSKVFGHPKAAPTNPKSSTLVASAPVATDAPAPVEPEVPAAVPTPPVEAPSVEIPATPPPVVDVAAVLDDLAKHNPEKLDWRRSIVDLMKLVDMDSSLSSRKELAEDLNYPGDLGDSAKMNIWLHKEVIKQLAANGGEVPADLLD